MIPTFCAEIISVRFTRDEFFQQIGFSAIEEKSNVRFHNCEIGRLRLHLSCPTTGNMICDLLTLDIHNERIGC
jgi:hypothetical protein